MHIQVWKENIAGLVAISFFFLEGVILKSLYIFNIYHFNPLLSIICLFNMISKGLLLLFFRNKSGLQLHDEKREHWDSNSNQMCTCLKSLHSICWAGTSGTCLQKEQLTQAPFIFIHLMNSRCVFPPRVWRSPPWWQCGPAGLRPWSVLVSWPYPGKGPTLAHSLHCHSPVTSARLWAGQLSSTYVVSKLTLKHQHHKSHDKC